MTLFTVGHQFKVLRWEWAKQDEGGSPIGFCILSGFVNSQETESCVGSLPTEVLGAESASEGMCSGNNLLLYFSSWLS